MRSGQILVQLECLVVAGDCLLRLTEFLERKAEVVMRFSQIGVDCQRLTIAGDGLLQLAKVLERKAEVAISLSIILLPLIKPEPLVSVYMMIVLLLTLDWSTGLKVGGLPQKMADLYGIRFQLQVQLCRPDYDM